MEWDIPWEPGLVLEESSGFSTTDQQQLITGMPTFEWDEPPVVVAAGNQTGKALILTHWLLP
jgi:hypothetical protein